MSELKPCPFCGGKAITSAFFDLDDLEYMAFEVNDSESIYGEVTCENERCINGWWLSQKEWNTRPIEDALESRIAELKHNLTNKEIEYTDLWDDALAFQARIAELEAERRWRVVADGEFPELGEEVIFYDSIMERRLKGCLRKNGGVEWLSDEGYAFSSRDGRYSRITHWMPLPKFPEVQE